MLSRLMACAALAVGLLVSARADAAIITRALSFEATFAPVDAPFVPANPLRFALQVTYDDSVPIGSGDTQTPPVVLSSNFTIIAVLYYYFPDVDLLGFVVAFDNATSTFDGIEISTAPRFFANVAYSSGFNSDREFEPTSLVVTEVAVPLPASLGLFGAGLIGLAVARGSPAGRRHRSAG